MGNKRIILWRTAQIIIVVMCLGLAGYAGKIGLADYYSRASYQMFLDWRGAMPAQEQWQAARDSLAQAIALHPGQPTYHHRMGRIEHVGMIVDRANREQHGEAAKTAMRTSLRIRPEWPHAWANLAWVKVALGERDAEFESALASAVRYGPWETYVHQIIATLGAYGLDGYSDDARALILASNTRGIMSAVRGAPPRVIDRVARYNERDQALQASYWGAALAQTEWDPARQRTYVSVMLDYWPHYSAAAREALVSKAAALPPESRAWRIIDGAGETATLCPYLPAGPAFDQKCTDSSR